MDETPKSSAGALPARPCPDRRHDPLHLAVGPCFNLGTAGLLQDLHWGLCRYDGMFPLDSVANRERGIFEDAPRVGLQAS